MTNKFARIAMALVVLASMMVVGCSEKKENNQKGMTGQTSEEQEIQSESSEKVLENNGKTVKKLLADPEPRTHGCLDGCRGLPCEEMLRCARRNCPSLKGGCEL